MPLAAPILSLCRESPRPGVASPAAVSRFGPAPVHMDRLDAMLLGTTTSSVDFCHTKRNTDAPRESPGPRTRGRLRPRPAASALSGLGDRRRAMHTLPSRKGSLACAPVGPCESRMWSTLLGWSHGAPARSRPDTTRLPRRSRVPWRGLRSPWPEATLLADAPAKGRPHAWVAVAPSVVMIGASGSIALPSPPNELLRLWTLQSRGWGARRLFDQPPLPLRMEVGGGWLGSVPGGSSPLG